MTTLITGFPAPRARAVLSALARRRPDAALTLLVHPSRMPEARAVSDELGFAPGGRVELVEGDPAAIDFGLAGDRYLALGARTRAVHAAYSITHPDVDTRTVEALNLGAAREMVELSRVAPRLDRLVWYSSVFVSGDRRGRVREDELAAGQSFRNAVERSLATAERMLCRSGAPLSILRAGHLLGAGFERASAPELCVELLMSTPPEVPLPLPPFADAALPLTPLDYLAEAGVAAPDSLPVGRTVHAIDPEPLTLGGFLELVAERLGRRVERSFKPGTLTRALINNPATRLLPRTRRVWLELLTTGGDYATDGALELSKHGGPACPPLGERLDGLIARVRERAERGVLDGRGRGEAPYLVA